MVLINSRQGETRTPEFLQINPYGQVPALQTESGYVLAESLAILIYLAEDTPLFSSDRLERAQILQWLAFEQTRIARYIAITRSWIIRGETEKYQNQIAIHHDLGTISLQIMEDHLEKHSFMVAERYTIADLALFAYTHIAEEGGFDLSSFPAILQWIERVKQQPRFIPFK